MDENLAVLLPLTGSGTVLIVCNAGLAALGPEAEGGDGLLYLVDHVGVLAFGMKSEVARPGAGIDAGSANLVSRICPVFSSNLNTSTLSMPRSGANANLLFGPT